jgi:hypothetical protein
MTRSAHSTSDTKIFGLSYCAPQLARSASVTPLARAQVPQAKIGIFRANHFAQEFGHPWPANRYHGFGHGPAHEPHGLAQEKDLDLVAGLGERVAVG